MRILVNRRYAIAASAASIAAPWATSRAQASPIVLGHTYPATGIFADTAGEMKSAIDAAAAEANALGGVRGRRIKVVSLDDGYDAQRSLANAGKLRGEEGAIALVAPVGFQTLEALMPWAETTRTPIIGARSGADVQRAYRRYTFFNIASFGDELNFIARHLDTISARRVAVAYMNNPTGLDLRRRAAAAAKAHSIELAGSVAFALDGGDAEAAAASLKGLGTPATIVAGAGIGAARVVGRLVRSGVPAASIYCMSLLQPAQLYRDLGRAANGMVFAQVMPILEDPWRLLPKVYRAALAHVPGARASPFGMEGYLAMRVALYGLARIEGVPGGAELATALDRAGAIDVSGWRLTYDGRSHHGTPVVELAMLSDGRLRR